jgi:hypothetical protein
VASSHQWGGGHPLSLAAARVLEPLAADPATSRPQGLGLAWLAGGAGGHGLDGRPLARSAALEGDGAEAVPEAFLGAGTRQGTGRDASSGAGHAAGGGGRESRRARRVVAIRVVGAGRTSRSAGGFTARAA